MPIPGGNDCGALRAAHAGIALSEAEASVVSPFTSKTKTVQSVVDVLCEGRCALATSFAAYRFYISYGLNWSVVKTINFVCVTTECHELRKPGAIFANGILARCGVI